MHHGCVALWVRDDCGVWGALAVGAWWCSGWGGGAHASCMPPVVRTGPAPTPFPHAWRSPPLRAACRPLLPAGEGLVALQEAGAADTYIPLASVGGEGG